MVIQKSSINQEISVKITVGLNITQCYSDINLNPSKKYIFRFDVKCSEATANFAIGLVYDNQICKKALICNLDATIEYKDNQPILNSGQISKVVKGNTTLMKCDQSLLELSIAYDQKFIQISDYPQGQNKYTHLSSISLYFKNFPIKLFIFMLSSKLTITLKEAFEVDQFS